MGSRVIAKERSEKMMILNPMALLLLTVLRDDVMKMLSWCSNCGEGVSMPVA